jgi:hypothetical protein
LSLVSRSALQQRLVDRRVALQRIATDSYFVAFPHARLESDALDV